jgi:hypothetical protein
MALFIKFRLSANTHTSAYPLLDSAIDLQKCCRCHEVKNRERCQSVSRVVSIFAQNVTVPVLSVKRNRTNNMRYGCVSEGSVLPTLLQSQVMESV